MLSNEDFDFVAGCSLGDGYLNGFNKRSTSPVFTLGHSQKQEEYLIWKAENLNRILNKNYSVHRSVRTVQGKQYPVITYSASVPELWEVYNLLYFEKKKVFTQALLERLGFQSLALLWMDDGVFVTQTHTTTSINSNWEFGWKGEKGAVRKYFREARLSLYTSKQEADIVNEWIKSLTGAEGRTYDQKKNNQFILLWNKPNFLKIIEAIYPFTHPSMYRKISLDLKRFDLFPVTVGERESAAKLDEGQTVV